MTMTDEFSEGLTPEQKYDLWIEALESGKFKQGAKCLANTNGGFCCIGVLAKINGYKPKGAGLSTYPDYCNMIGRNHYFCPGETYEVFAHLGMGHLISEDSAANLAIANDHGKTFSDIASALKLHKERGFRGVVRVF